MTTQDLKNGNPGLSDTPAQYGLRRAREVYERHGDPADGLRLVEVQLAAIIAGAYEDGVAAECKERDDVVDEDYGLVMNQASQPTPSRIVPARLAPHVEGLLPERGEE
jgi:hypothetical protein